MNPIHWLRARQEGRELGYWLSIVAYDRQDRSLDNRIYLVYLVIFFTIWIFITLTLLASGTANVLAALSPADPRRAAALLETIMLSLWSLVTLRQAARRSPVPFSAEDEMILCQTPLSRRLVVLRWLPMPWLKSAIPFWLAAVVLGFGVADLAMAGQMAASKIPAYFTYGLRAWAAILPVHLCLFLVSWIVGLARLQQGKRQAFPLAIVPGSLVLIYLGVILAWFSSQPVLPLQTLGNLLAWPVMVGFTGGSELAWTDMAGFTGGSLATFLLAATLVVALLLGLLGHVAEGASLSRAAMESSEEEAIRSALQYGFTSYAQALQAQRSMGVERRPSRIPARPGPAALFWKDLVQTSRSTRLVTALGWSVFFSSCLGLALLPDLSTQAILTAFWVLQAGKVSTVRIKTDLERWPVVRQLPVAQPAFILSDGLFAFLLAVVLSAAGFAAGSVLAKAPLSQLAALLPGMAASAAGWAVFDLVRRARPALLMGGSAPEAGVGGALGGVVFVAIPLLVYHAVPGIPGWLLATAFSLLLGWAAFALAAWAWRKIPSA